MKAMNSKAMILATLGILPLLLSACSVQTAHVENEPPLIEGGIVKFQTHYGKMDPLTKLSLFYWPVSDDSERNQNVVETVTKLAEMVDQIPAKILELEGARSLLQKEFQFLNCIGAVAEESAMDAAKDNAVMWVSKWKTFEPVAPGAAGYEAYKQNLDLLQKCMVNQGTREKVAGGLAQARAAETQIPVYEQTIVATIGKENFQIVTAQGSSLEIKPGLVSPSVELTLANFLRPGNVQSTAKGPGKIQNASYDVRTKLLRFVVPVLDAQNQPTGEILAFAMERGPDLLGQARFSGEARLMKGDKVLRYGSAKIVGELKN